MRNRNYLKLMLAVIVVLPSLLRADDWLMYQHDIQRTGFNAAETKINRTSVALLGLKWRHALPDVVTASPAVATVTCDEQTKKVVYVGSADGKFYALDAGDGSELWNFTADPAPGLAYHMFVSSAFVDKDSNRLYVGGGYTMYALDLCTGNQAWKWSTAPAHGRGEIESSPVVVNGVVYFGSDLDAVAPGTPETPAPFPALFAVKADSGALEWYWRPSDAYSGNLRCGDVWSSVAVDPDEGLLYFDTSDCTRNVQELYNEAIIALPIVGPIDSDKQRTDKPNWYYQPRTVDPYDFDFGASPLLFDGEDGKYLGVGGKDGYFYVLRREQTDTDKPELPFIRCPVWKKRVTRGGYAAGFIGSAATDGRTIFSATALFEMPSESPSKNATLQPPYLHAFNAFTGDILWQQVLTGPTFAATTAVNDVVFIGSTDDTFMALDSETGQILWAASALGAAISSGAAVVDGEVFVGAGTTAEGIGQGPLGAVYAFHLPPGDLAPEASNEIPPKLPPATWPLRVVEYPFFPDDVVGENICPQQ